MLTKQDKTDIANIVRPIMQEELRPIKRDVNVLKKDMITVKNDIKKIKKDLKDTINFFDHEVLADRKRIDKLEKNYNLQQSFT